MSLVSINDVLEITTRVEKIHPYKVVGDRDSYSPYNEGWSDCVSLIEHYLEQVPSAEPERKWIPVSEELPEEDIDVLLQFPHTMAVGYQEDGFWNIITCDDLYSGLDEEDENANDTTEVKIYDLLSFIAKATDADAGIDINYDKKFYLDRDMARSILAKDTAGIVHERGQNFYQSLLDNMLYHLFGYEQLPKVHGHLM